MTSNTIIQILKDHSIEHFTENGHIMALESIDPKGGDEYKDVTGMEYNDLYLWLGYDIEQD